VERAESLPRGLHARLARLIALITATRFRHGAGRKPINRRERERERERERSVSRFALSAGDKAAGSTDKARSWPSYLDKCCSRRGKLGMRSRGKKEKEPYTHTYICTRTSDTGHIRESVSFTTERGGAATPAAIKREVISSAKRLIKNTPFRERERERERRVA